MIRTLVFLVLLIVLSATPQAVSAMSSDQVLQLANKEYENADCEHALRHYRAFRKLTKDPEQRDMASFRIGYCALNLDKNELAIEEFGEIVKNHPEEEEARLRYATALLNSEQYEESVKNASQISDPELLTEARVLQARGLIESQRADRALAALSDLKQVDSGWEPVVEFWKGMAYFQMFDENKAESSFKKVFQSSPNEYWTKTAATNWLATLDDAKSMFHARLGVTYGYDSNVDQVRYADSSGGSETAYQTGAFSAYDLMLSPKPIHWGKVSILPSASAYLQYYTDSLNSTYNPSLLTGDVTATYSASYRWTHRASLSYSEARYNATFFQDYATLNLASIYGVSKHMTVHVAVSGSRVLGSAQGWTYNPNIGAEGDLPWFYWLATLGWTNKIGSEAAVGMPGGIPTLLTGTLFSDYQAINARLGVGRVLFWGLDFLGQLTWSNTTYQSQSLPLGAAFNADSRHDTSYGLQFNLSRTLIERRLTATALYSLSNVQSAGFQGLITSSNTGPDYSGMRSLVSFNLSYGF